MVRSITLRSAAVCTALVVVTTAGLLAQLPGAPTPRNLTVAEALDMFERGDRSVLAGFSRIENRLGVSMDLQKAGPNWARAKGEAARPRRLLMLAAFTLELVRGGSGGSGLLEWACDAIRPPYGPKKPLPEEILWHHAVFAHMQQRAGYRETQTHLWHVARRYKNEPGIALAHAWMKLSEWENMSREVSFGGNMRSYVGAGGPAPPTTRWDVAALAREAAVPRSLIAPTPRPRPGSEALAALAPVRSASDGSTSVWTQPTVLNKVSSAVINAYKRAASASSTAAEAELRLGYLYLVGGRLDEAVPHFTRVRVLSKDSGQRYLAELMTGWTEERANRLDEAERAYRRALGTRPSGRTAATWLAMLLQSRGKLGEAQAVIDASLEAPATSPDPWPQFGQGEYKNFPDLVDRFREALWSGRSR